uniref:Metallophosphoesterase n=1 Tax=Cyanothece sp. (strain PCC 7425 / ATCC 29141) TaxID=395961 RepID=B8HRT0_CYAP4
MRLVSDPAIADKIRQMQRRVRWQDSRLLKRGIDQTRLAIEDGQSETPAFSFLVIGDSGSGPHRSHNPQRAIMEQMLPHLQDCRFLLHTGDVIYLLGSSEYYPKNFIEPYRELLVGGETFDQITYQHMVFNLPFLPVPGNHDYYDLPPLLTLLSVSTLPLRRLLQTKLDLDVGWHGSHQGDAYARAFLDYLKALSPEELEHHLSHHYTAQTSSGYALAYRPGQFTRLPNRYYTFRYGGIDFFALDSNTFNAPLPPPTQAAYHAVEQRRDQLEAQRNEILTLSARLNPLETKDAEQLDDLHTKLSQIEEEIVDSDKQLNAADHPLVDGEQLNWLKQRLIQSWQTLEVRGRILYFHHPPYVTEATKWNQGQTLAIRGRLRQVLDAVAAEVQLSGKPIVDLIFNGHAHCLEYIQTGQTGYADSHLHYLVCGGSGFSLRRQRSQGPDLAELDPMVIQPEQGNGGRVIAHSKLFVGRTGYGSQKRRPYSALRVDVQPGSPPQFVIRPLVAEWSQQQWHTHNLAPFKIGEPE